jgi:hypothetical protein
MVLAMGFEGSANKVAVGITRGDEILSNPRHTCARMSHVPHVPASRALTAFCAAQLHHAAGHGLPASRDGGASPSAHPAAGGASAR